MNETLPAWDVKSVADAKVPSSQEDVDAAFADIMAPHMSSGWVCTLTIECGTVVCACR